jgi:hypothetical protein
MLQAGKGEVDHVHAICAVFAIRREECRDLPTLDVGVGGVGTSVGSSQVATTRAFGTCC